MRNDDNVMKCKLITVSPAGSEGAGESRRMTGKTRHRPYANRCRYTAQEPRGGGFRTGRGPLAPAGDTGTPLTPRPRSRLEQAAERPQPHTGLQPDSAGQDASRRGTRQHSYRMFTAVAQAFESPHGNLTKHLTTEYFRSPIQQRQKRKEPSNPVTARLPTKPSQEIGRKRSICQ